MLHLDAHRCVNSCGSEFIDLSTLNDCLYSLVAILLKFYFQYKLSGNLMK